MNWIYLKFKWFWFEKYLISYNLTTQVFNKGLATWYKGISSHLPKPWVLGQNFSYIIVYD